MDYNKRLFSFVSAMAVLILISPFQPILAQTAPTLGAAQSFAVLGAAAVTNTGPTVLNGDLGVSPGNSITGFPPGTVNGTTHNGDAVAAQAQTDANTAYNSLAGQPCNTILTGQDLGGLTLTPGVYCFASTAQLTGTLTLNAQGNPNAVFIFKIGSSLTTASNSSVVLINGAQACSVFFQVGSSATLGTGTQFIGSILAVASVTLNTNATLSGRAIGMNGAVTLDSNTVSVPLCGTVQVCKVAGLGVAVGTNFGFNVAGISLIVPAGIAPGGSCSIPVQVSAGATLLAETVPAGVTLTGVSTSPSLGLLISSNLAAGSAIVAVGNGGQTIVTFVDAAVPPPPPGLVQVCKVAGTGIAVGTSFSFNVAGTAQTIQAGLGPGGTCGAPVAVPAGAVLVTETIPSGTLVAGISTSPSPGLLVNSNLLTGTATVTVLAGGQTIVTFIDAAPTTGLIQVCKVGGPGVPLGTNFTFSVGGVTVVVPAGAAPGGSCSPALVAPPGPIVITERLVSNLQDSYQVRYASNLNIGDSVVNFTNAGTFIDPSVPATSGNICVNAYTFDASEELLSCCSCLVTPNGLDSLSVRNDLISNTLTPGVPTSVVIKLVASTPVGGLCSPSLPTGATLVSGLKAWGTTLHLTPTTPLAYATTETPFIPASLGSSQLFKVSTSPSPGLLVTSNLALGTATVTVTPAGLTIVTFTNGFVSAELNRITTLCRFIQSNGSGFGICKSCRLGGFGANHQ